MCKLLEEMREEARQENSIDMALRMLEDGKITPEKIAEYVDLPIDTVRDLRARMKKG